MWLKGEARDPAEVIERREARTCKGCVHETALYFLGEYRKSCDKQRKHSDQGGKRCKRYVEKEGKKYA